MQALARKHLGLKPGRTRRQVVERTMRGECVRLLGKQAGQLPSLSLPKIRKNPMVEILPLSTGCLGACTYCKTKHARGRKDLLPRGHSFEL